MYFEINKCISAYKNKSQTYSTPSHYTQLYDKYNLNIHTSNDSLHTTIVCTYSRKLKQGQAMKRVILGVYFILLSSFFFTTHAFASVTASSNFVATKTCQAYQSFRKKTNPGEVTLTIGQNYPIININKPPDQTTLYQIRITGASPQNRWVYFECGNAEVTQHGTSQPSRVSDKSCQTKDLGESYLLAISWQPAFCETHANKPECSVQDSDAYQANNFTLHGLWPNKKSCGTRYGFCGKYKKKPAQFSGYDPVPMASTTLETLGKFMPSAAHESYLQRHEWYKHGTCQSEWDAGQYYQTAIRLLHEFNEPYIKKFMTENIGKLVTTSSFFAAVDQTLGADAHTRLQISCKNNLLVDVFIQLPKNIPDTASLSSLVQNTKPNFRNNCGDRFKIDKIGQ